LILITTSRRPIPITRTFCNQLSRVIPNSKRINRGTAGINDLIIKANEENADLVIIIDSSKGNPSRIRFLKIEGIQGDFYPFELYLKGVDLYPKYSRKKKVSEKAKLEIISLSENKRIINLGKILSDIFNCEFKCIPNLIKPGLRKIVIEDYKKNKEKKSYLVLDIINKKINILFFDEDFYQIGPRIIVKDYIIK